uniref:Uncharacterized protein n=1 Tax=Bursaphelenchus xylophilus TaxID=6326 RepID=A0A1I7RP47_BURXY
MICHRRMTECLKFKYRISRASRSVIPVKPSNLLGMGRNLELIVLIGTTVKSNAEEVSTLTPTVCIQLK